ncbi:hypothetical protein [Actinophytocola sp.]|uniref:hypothetical protein n=1 Tax=Actinophytocola sp. TaxID=1872138 RepID=UPI002D7F3BB7|nr:hypothetical protein [Actinophytocola sp.]HET9141629.1 hypothetical protein [Actinophytocola sp.]
MSERESGEREQVVFGVPAQALVDALRGAGMADADVVAVVGRGIAASAGVTVEADRPPFVFQTQVAQTAPDVELSFVRTFTHPDFIDGVTVVQAAATPEEIGFNQRFHAIESDLDDISDDLHTASNGVAELRLELFGIVQELQVKITEIEARIDAKDKDKEKEKEGKDTKEKDKDGQKDGKDKEGKDGKDDQKDGKEKEKEKDKEKEGEKDGHKEFADLTDALPAGSDVDEGSGTGERTFITLEERPEVGRPALSDPDGDE